MVAAGIISSELHKRLSDDWITTFELISTEAFAKSAFSKSSRSMALFTSAVSELDKLNIIRRHSSDQNRLQWKRPNYRRQFDLCKDDQAIKIVSVAANASLMVAVKTAATAIAEIDARAANADVVILEAQVRRRVALSNLEASKPL